MGPHRSGPPSSRSSVPAVADDEIALRHSGQMDVLTRVTIGSRKWIRVSAELENLTLRLDSLNSSVQYSKEMTITAGTTVLRSPQQGRPHCISIADFNAASGRKRLLDCGTAAAAETWFDFLSRIATNNLDTLLQPLREAREKEIDAAELGAALASRPPKVDEALLALRRDRLDADYVGRDASERGVTALLAAARAARADVVEALLKLGAAPDGPHHTTLPRKGKKKVANAGPGQQQSSSKVTPRVEETPLLGAVRTDSHKAVLKLLNGGANPTLQDDSRETPLLAASRLGGAKIATALMKHIATLAAAEQPDSKRRAELIGHVDEEFGIDPSTALAAAAAAGHAGVVAALCSGGRSRSPATGGASHRRHGSAAVVTIAAAVDRRDAIGRTAAHHAAWRGRAAVIVALADAGADLDARDADGNTPLQLAAAEGHVATVAALLQRDAAAPLQRQRLPATEPAMRASELVAATAELRCALGAAEFDAARAGELALAVRRVLRESAFESSTKQHDPSGQHQHSPAVSSSDGGGRGGRSGRYHRESRGDPQMNNFPADVCALPPSRQLTALLRCCQNGDGQGVELWLKIGADANHADHNPRERCTPLMACAIRGDRHLCKILLATGRCDIDARDANGATALCRAALAAARSRTVPVNAASARDVATLLLEHGADPLKRDHKDRSPLSIAAADARDVQLVDRMMSTSGSLFGSTTSRGGGGQDTAGGIDISGGGSASAAMGHRRKISMGAASDISDDAPPTALAELASLNKQEASPTTSIGADSGSGTGSTRLSSQSLQVVKTTGIDVDAPHGKYGATSLMMAAAMPEVSAVLRMLLGAHDLAADAGLKQRRTAPKKGVRTANLHKVDSRGRTALFYAAEADRAENVELLLNFGRRASSDAGDLGAMLDVDAVDRNGQTALQVATGAHAHGAVGALLRFGASASSTTLLRTSTEYSGSAALGRKQGFSTARMLSPIADAQSTAESMTPGTVYQETPASLRSDRGAFFHSSRSSENGPVFDDEDGIKKQHSYDEDTADEYYARRKGGERPLSAFALDHGDAQIAGTLGRFRMAIVAGDDACTLRYVERGNYEVDEPAGDDNGSCTALLVACRLGHAPAAARLLEAGADANKADARGETPLLAAARSGALLDARVDRAATRTVTRALADDGSTAQRAASPASRVASLGQLLLDAGADATAVDDHRKESALHVVAGASERGAPQFVGGAARRGEAAALLLSRGADPLAQDAAGRTPLLLASGAWPPRDVEDVASLGGASSGSANYCREDAPDARCVLEAILDAHRTARQKNDSSCFDLDFRHETPGGPVVTALGAAAVAGRLMAVRALLAAGANPNADADLQGRAALALAAEAGHAPVVRILAPVSAIEHRAGPANRSALHAAAEAAQTATVAALMAAGAVAETRDAGGAEPLDLAKQISDAPQASSTDSAQGGNDSGGSHSFFDGDERSMGERAAAVAARLSVMRYAVEARIYARAADLANKGNFSLVSGDGAAALENASREGDSDGVRALLDVDNQGTHQNRLAEARGARALNAAAIHRRPRAARVLLCHGATPSPRGAAALLALAVDVGDDDLLRLALAVGADAAAPSDAGADIARTVVSYDNDDQYFEAAKQRDVYARAHEPSEIDHDPAVPHLSALARAASAPAPRGVDMLKQLLGDVDSPAKDPPAIRAARRETLVRSIAATQGGGVTSARVVRAHPPDAALTPSTGSSLQPVSPVHAAAAADCFDALALLLRFCRENDNNLAVDSDDPDDDLAMRLHDAPYARDSKGRTPLHVAAAQGAYDAAAVMVTLLASESDHGRQQLLSATDGAGATSLARAARVDDGAVVSLLLGAGAFADALDAHGRSARDLAPAGGRARRRLEVMRTAIAECDFDKSLSLVERGCFSVSTTAADHRATLLTCATACGRVDVVEAALKLGAAARAKDSPPIPKLAAPSPPPPFVRSGKSARFDTCTPSNEMEAALSAAMRCRQPTTAEALLKSRNDVRPILDDAAPLLRLAVCRRRYDLIKLLLLRGAEPLAPCVSTCDVVARASEPMSDKRHGNMSVLPVGDTSAAEARSTLTEKCDVTPFMLSVSSGDLEAVKIFLDQRVAVFDVDVRDAQGATALMEALCRGHVHVAHALIAAGADCQATDSFGRSALERACFEEPGDKAMLRDVQSTVGECRRLKKAKEDAAKERQKKIDAEAAVVTEDVALRHDVVSADLDEIDSDGHAQVDSAIDQGGYPPHTPKSTEFGKPAKPTPSRSMKDLLRASAITAERKVLKTPLTPSMADDTDSEDGGNVHFHRRENESRRANNKKPSFEARIDNALALAVAQRNAVAVDELLLAGADALAQCTDAKRRSDAETPLLRACRQPDLATLAALLNRAKPDRKARGFDVDAPHGSVKAAALAITAASGDADCIRLLLDAGADVARLDANGRGPIWHAASRGHANVVHLLASSLKEQHGDAFATRALDAVDVAGATPLHAAAKVGAHAAIASLLQHGADATVRDANGHTPRRVALACGLHDTAEQLDAMSIAIVDGDYAECIRLARNGNWPLDWKVGEDDDDDERLQQYQPQQ